MEMRRLPAHPRNVLSLVRLRRLIQLIRPDVVHGHSSVGGVLARVSALGTDSTTFYTPNGIQSTRIALNVERSLRPLTDILIAVSPSEADLAIELGLVDERHLTMVPNGIELVSPPEEATLDLRQALGIERKARLVGCVVRLVPQKAPELFVRAAAAAAQQLNDVHFVLIGSGPLQKSVVRTWHDVGSPPRVHLVPAIARASTVLGQLQLFVFATAFEGGPYTPLEAMRAKVPVILSDVVGNRDVVEDGRSGILVPCGDQDSLTDAIIRVLSEPELQDRLKEGASRRLTERFDIKHIGARMAELYRCADPSTGST